MKSIQLLSCLIDTFMNQVIYSFGEESLKQSLLSSLEKSNHGFCFKKLTFTESLIYKYLPNVGSQKLSESTEEKVQEVLSRIKPDSPDQRSGKNSASTVENVQSTFEKTTGKSFLSENDFTTSFQKEQQTERNQHQSTAKEFCPGIHMIESEQRNPPPQESGKTTLNSRIPDQLPEFAEKYKFKAEQQQEKHLKNPCAKIPLVLTDTKSLSGESCSVTSDVKVHYDRDFISEVEAPPQPKMNTLLITLTILSLFLAMMLAIDKFFSNSRNEGEKFKAFSFS